MTTETGSVQPVLARDEPAWEELVGAVLRDPSRMAAHFQPIVSLQEALVVGYEALARFAGPPGLTPDRWFTAADRLGYGAELEALMVRRCLDLRSSLPADCFLAVNVSPHLLARPALRDLLLGAGDLRPLVVELTEHRAVGDVTDLAELCVELRRRGALVALDDAGSGYSGLQQIAQLRPQLVKLDRALVADADRSPVKLALAEVLGELAGRIDAWLLAEGLETWDELDAFLRLRVPLGQGYLLGRPAPPWARLDEATARRLRAGAARSQLVEHVASLVERVPLRRAGDPDPPPLAPGRAVVVVDEHGAPVGVQLPDLRAGDVLGRHHLAAGILRVSASTSVTELARRVVAREDCSRYDPVVCVDDRGRAIGIVRVDALLLRLAELKSGT